MSVESSVKVPLYKFNQDLTQPASSLCPTVDTTKITEAPMHPNFLTTNVPIFVKRLRCILFLRNCFRILFHHLACSSNSILRNLNYLNESIDGAVKNWSLLHLDHFCSNLPELILVGVSSIHLIVSLCSFGEPNSCQNKKQTNHIHKSKTYPFGINSLLGT